MQPKSFRALEILHKYVIMYPIPKRMVILMKIDVITYRDKLYDNMLNGHTVIVIDVLRCTSAIIAALDTAPQKSFPRSNPAMLRHTQTASVSRTVSSAVNAGV